jgi:hypothetical protein
VSYLDAWKALASGDLAGFLAFVADDVQWWELGSVEPIRGRRELEEHLGRGSEVRLRADLHDVLANDEHLVALVHAIAPFPSGDIDISYAEVLHFDDDGLMTKRQMFPADIWAAMKLLDGRQHT